MSSSASGWAKLAHWQPRGWWPSWRRSPSAAAGSSPPPRRHTTRRTTWSQARSSPAIFERSPGTGVNHCGTCQGPKPGIGSRSLVCDLKTPFSFKKNQPLTGGHLRQRATTIKSSTDRGGGSRGGGVTWAMIITKVPFIGAGSRSHGMPLSGLPCYPQLNCWFRTYLRLVAVSGHLCL